MRRRADPHRRTRDLDRHHRRRRAPLAVGAALAGALNTLPVTALGLGVAILAIGRAPALVVAVGMLPTTGGFVLDVVADSTGAPEWVSSLSPYDHLAAVPVDSPDLPATTAMLAVAAAFAMVGTWSYTRRDVG